MEMQVLGCNRWRVVLSLVVMLLMQECTGHIRLTYPPARTYQFDFLDNVRTPGPCGMPKGLGGVQTNLQAGGTLDIHWHLSYPHKGGYYFDVRDANNTVRARYPPTGYEGTADGTSLAYSVSLPSEPCEGCVFRMVRQAAEWGASYLFWSCADVNIMAGLPLSDMCSGRGTYENSRCVCQRLYKGDRCQFKDECDADSDCGQQGICVDTRATSYPVHQCYCQQGWFGPQCQYQSSVTSKPADLSVYQTAVLSPDSDVTLYYRIVQDEVEVMMKAQTRSWMGLGWRPAGTKASCQSFPNVGDYRYVPEGNGVPESEGEPGAEGEHADSEGEPGAEGEHAHSEGEPGAEGEHAHSEGEPGAESEYHGNSTAEPEGTAEGEHAEPGAESEYHGNSTAEPEVIAEGESHAEGEPEGEGTAEPGAESEYHGNSTAEPEVTPEGESHAEPGAESEYHGNSTAEPEVIAEGESTAEPGAEGEGHADGESHAEGEPGAEGESTGEPGAEGESTGEPGAEGEAGAEGEGEGEPGAEGESGSSGKTPHPMDCTDIVIGSARGSFSRIGDYYTRDRSTPVHDEYLGGSDSLSAGLVWEEGDHTYMLFRKKLDAGSEPTDHSLSNELTHVIWAFGQQQDENGQYNHRPNSALENPNVSIPDFYRQDELKYHGHQGQRGATSLNFFSGANKATDDEGEDCTRGSCKARECGLDFSWTYDASTDVITFNVSAKYLAPDTWIGLGFSDDQRMEKTDVVFGGIGGDGAPFVTDGWLSEKAPPRVAGEPQDASLLSGGLQDSRTTLVFTRRRVTGDPNDLDLSQCRYVFFAKGGNIRDKTTITKHSSTPFISRERICFGVCGTGVSDERFVTPVSVSLDTPFQETYRDRSSSDYQNFVGRIKPDLENHFRTKLGPMFLSIDIKNLKPGSVIVDFEVVTQSQDSVQTVSQEVEVASRNLTQVSTYPATLLTVQETYRASATGTTDRSEPHTELLTETEIIIIAVVLALIAVALLVGICKFCESRRSRRNDKQRVMNGESSSQSSGSGSGSGSRSAGSRSGGGDPESVKKGMMTYGQFMATNPENGDPRQPPPYPAFANPGYDTAGYKNVP